MHTFSSRRECVLNSDYDVVRLDAIPSNYIQRVNYAPANSINEFSSRIQSTPWGSKFNMQYMLCSRKMLNLTTERSLISAILPPGVTYINGLFGMVFRNDISVIAGSMFSLVYDFFMRITGKSNAQYNAFSAFPVLDKSRCRDFISQRALLLNCLTVHYSQLWEKEYKESFKEDSWSKNDNRLDNKRFREVSSRWSEKTPLRTDYERRQALIELDVLVSISLGLTIEQLINIYRIQFPVLQSYENNTYYDQKGRIVYTNNRGLLNVGLSREEWEKHKNLHEGIVTQEIEDDVIPGGPYKREIEYVAPFDCCNRELDYATAWKFFKNKFGE